MGYIGLRLWVTFPDIFGKKYGIYWDKTIFYGIYAAKAMRYIAQKLWDVLWDIVFKSYGIYLTKTKGYLW